MKVRVNGVERELASQTTVADVVTSLGAASRSGVAVARNGEVVVRSAWHTTGLDDGDRVEVLGALQGG